MKYYIAYHNTVKMSTLSRPRASCGIGIWNRSTSPLLPQGKYEVSRQLGLREASPVTLPKQLPAAA